MLPKSPRRPRPLLSLPQRPGVRASESGLLEDAVNLDSRPRGRRERGAACRGEGAPGPRQDGRGHGHCADGWRRPVRRAGLAARRRGPGLAALEAGAVSIAAAGGVAPGNFLVPGLGYAGILLEGKQWGGGHCGSCRRAGTCSATGTPRSVPILPPLGPSGGHVFLQETLDSRFWFII